MVMRLVAGSGRSGTTWVLDALASANGLRPVFEPLHPLVSPVGRQFAHRCVSADEFRPELEEFLDETINGGRLPLWTKYRTLGRWLAPPASELASVGGLQLFYRRWRKFLRDAPGLTISATRREPLVKCIYANLMLGWLSRHCKFRIVLIVRHPGAVIESELRGGWKPTPALDRFNEDDCLHSLTRNRYRRLLARTLSPIEGLAVRWVVENQVALEQAASNRIAVAFYEDLRTFPDREWKAICAALDLQNAPAAQLVSRPSQQSSGASSAAHDDSIEPRWMKALSREQCELIQQILDEAQFSLYSMRDAAPQRAPVAFSGLRLHRPAT